MRDEWTHCSLTRCRNYKWWRWPYGWPRGACRGVLPIRQAPVGSLHFSSRMVFWRFKNISCLYTNLVTIIWQVPFEACLEQAEISTELPTNSGWLSTHRTLVVESLVVIASSSFPPLRPRTALPIMESHRLEIRLQRFPSSETCRLAPSIPHVHDSTNFGTESRQTGGSFYVENLPRFGVREPNTSSISCWICPIVQVQGIWIICLLQEVSCAVKSAGGKLATEASHQVIGYGTSTISILPTRGCRNTWRFKRNHIKTRPFQDSIIKYI